MELVLTNKQSFVIFLCSQLFLHKSFLQFGENFCNKLFVSFAPVSGEVVSTNSIYWVKQNTKLAANRTNNDTILFSVFYEIKIFLFFSRDSDLTTSFVRYNETAKHCSVTSLLSAGCYIHRECNKISL